METLTTKQNISESESKELPKLMTRLEFMNHFHITKRCEKYWRKAGKFPYVQIGRKVYYQVSDVIKFQENHKNS